METRADILTECDYGSHPAEGTDRVPGMTLESQSPASNGLPPLLWSERSSNSLQHFWFDSCKLVSVLMNELKTIKRLLSLHRMRRAHTSVCCSWVGKHRGAAPPY